jgi:hypothetical protein
MSLANSGEAIQLLLYIFCTTRSPAMSLPSSGEVSSQLVFLIFLGDFFISMKQKWDFFVLR